MIGTASTVAAMRWPRILVSAVIVAALTFVFTYLVVYSFVVSYPAVVGEEPSPDRVRRFAFLMSTWGQWTAFFALSAIAASRVVRRAGELPRPHGVLTGVAAALVLQGFVLLFVPPVEGQEALIYLIAGFAGGWVGAGAGRRALAREGAFRRTSERIIAAETPENVASAIGTGDLLGVGGVGSVDLWRARRPEETGAEPLFERWASWSLDGGAPSAGSPRLDATQVLDPLEDGEPVFLRAEDVRRSEAYEGRSSTDTSFLVVPIVARADARIGLLVVGFRGVGRVSANERRSYAQLARQAATVLENMRLVAEARYTGHETGVLRERDRYNGELHDTTAQRLTGIAMLLQSVLAAIDRGGTVSRQIVERTLEEAKGGAREVRALMLAREPEELDRHSLWDAIGYHAASWSSRTGIGAEAKIEGEPRRVRSDAEAALFRAAQEALSNVEKHAKARSVEVRIVYAEDGDVVLVVTDDGVGIGAEDGRRVREGEGLGLPGMAKRVGEASGSVTVEKANGKGTRVMVRMPTAKPADEVEPRDGDVLGATG